MFLLIIAATIPVQQPLISHRSEANTILSSSPTSSDEGSADFFIIKEDEEYRGRIELKHLKSSQCITSGQNYKAMIDKMEEYLFNFKGEIKELTFNSCSFDSELIQEVKGKIRCSVRKINFEYCDFMITGINKKILKEKLIGSAINGGVHKFKFIECNKVTKDKTVGLR